MQIDTRPGKFKYRITIDWTIYDPLVMGRWCWENLGKPNKRWLRKSFIAGGDIWYFYFLEEKDVILFKLRWS
jgi:hypothetical protein